MHIDRRQLNHLRFGQRGAVRPAPVTLPPAAPGAHPDNQFVVTTYGGTGANVAPQAANQILITPTGGTQINLADALGVFAAGPFLPLIGGILSGPLTLPAMTKHAAADGDTAITLNHNTFMISTTDLNVTGFAAYPAYLQYINLCPNFLGPYSSNWQQYAPLACQGVSGPTSTGNTSAITLTMDSYGMNPSGAYDVCLNVQSMKFGQTSNWGIVVNCNDFTGKVPQAFASWNGEYDIVAHGYDLVPWDPTYGMPGASNRVGSYYNFSTLPLAAWAANTAVTAKATTQALGPAASTILVTASSVQYVWYCVQSGTTGATSPTFPAPVEFVATISSASGTMTVTSITQGTLATGMYVTLSGTIATIQITGQTSGTTGGVGVYTVSVSGAANIATARGCWAAPNVADGTAVWAFGNTYVSSVSAGIWFVGNAYVDTVIGAAIAVTGAFIDTTQSSFGSSGAALRIKTNQIIDFSGNGTLAGRNQHFLQYSSFVRNGALAYNNSHGTLLALTDPYNSFTTGTVETTPVTSLASGLGGDISTYSTGFNPTGLTVAHNATGVFGETDLLCDTNGLYIYPVTAGGAITPTAPILRIDGSGNLFVTGTYRVGTLQVVGAQIAGWGTSSGGARGAVAAGTATLPQVAAALAQLLTDLKTHGLIGT